jgi:hypothetical protein
VPLLQLNVAPLKKELRWFAGLWWPLLCAFAGSILIRKLHLPGAAIGLWIGGGLLAASGLISPAIIRPLYIGLLWLTYPIGFVFSYVLLFTVYFFIFAPVGALVRVFHDPMARRFDHGASSYWTAHEPDSLDRYFRQF